MMIQQQQQQPPPKGDGGGAVYPSSMDDQHQKQPLAQKQQQQQHDDDGSQPTTTTSAASAAEEEKVRTLWIGDLEPWMSEEYIYLCFEHTGEVFRSRVIRDEETGRSECFGFIQFETHAIADSFLHKFNGKPMLWVEGSRLFTLNWAVSDDGIFTTPTTTTYSYNNNNHYDGTTTTTTTTHDDSIPTECGFYCSRCTPHPPIPRHLRAKPWSPKKKKTVGGGGGGGGAPQESQTVVDYQRINACIRMYNFEMEDMEDTGVISEEFGDLLDELKEYVEFVDVASELHSIDGLSHLLFKLTDSNNAGIEAKVAELITAMVHNNPTAQELVMEEKGVHILLHTFISGSDATVRIKIFYALSALIWNNEPGVNEFRSRNGYVGLRDALLTSVTVAFQRKALDLIQHLLHENSSDCIIVTELGFPSIMMDLLSISDDAEVREAALGCLIVLARVEEVGGNRGLLVKNDDKLKQVLKGLRVKGISAMTPEDLGSSRKERQLVDSLWNACYNEPSSLREKDNEEDSQVEDTMAESKENKESNPFCVESISGPAHNEVDFDKNKNLEFSGAPQESQTVVDDVVAQRVHQIGPFLRMHPLELELNGVTSAKFEDLLDELKEYVNKSIVDVASELHSIGGLSHLLHILLHKLTNPGIEAKVAELITAMVHNNPRAQQLVMEEKGVHILLYCFISGYDATVRINVFYALSSLIWNNKPGVTEFRSRNGYVALRDALLTSMSVAFQRKALDLIQHLLHDNSSDCNIVTELGFPLTILDLAFSVDAEVREAALGCLVVLARVEEVGGEESSLSSQTYDKLKQVLKVLTAPEDLCADGEERQFMGKIAFLIPLCMKRRKLGGKPYFF